MARVSQCVRKGDGWRERVRECAHVTHFGIETSSARLCTDHIKAVYRNKLYIFMGFLAMPFVIFCVCAPFCSFSLSLSLIRPFFSRCFHLLSFSRSLSLLPIYSTVYYSSLHGSNCQMVRIHFLLVA